MGRIYQNQNQILLQELIPIYLPLDYPYRDYDWLWYPISYSKKSSINILTLHHVIKAAEGGPLCIGNAALLTKRSHQDLNTCEAKDHILYDEINDFFRKIIKIGKPLNEQFINDAKEYNSALKKAIHPKRYK